jgi:hypothetical protein
VARADPGERGTDAPSPFAARIGNGALHQENNADLAEGLMNDGEVRVARFWISLWLMSISGHERDNETLKSAQR